MCIRDSTHGVVTPEQVSAQATGIATLLQSGQNAQAGAHGNRPKAFINYILLDEQFKYAGGGASMVADAGTFKQHFADLQNIAVPKNGYIYVYCSNAVSYTHLDVYKRQVRTLARRNGIFTENEDGILSYVRNHNAPGFRMVLHLSLIHI